MSKAIYDPNEVTVSVGNTPIYGFDNDSMISIEFDEPSYKKDTDLSGDSVFFKSHNTDCKITLKIKQTSPSNDVLSSYVQANRISNAGIFPVMIKDGNGKTLITSEAALVEQTPTVEFGGENKNREWVIIALRARNFVGGN